MSDFTAHYQRPVGPWGQRIAGAVLAVAIVVVAWALWPTVVTAWRDGMSPGEGLAALIAVAAMLWLVLLTIRLVRARPTSGDVLPPVALMGFGIVIAAALCAVVAISFVERVTVLNPLEILEGFVVATVAISTGVRRRGRRSLASALPRGSSGGIAVAGSRAVDEIAQGDLQDHSHLAREAP